MTSQHKVCFNIKPTLGEVNIFIDNKPLQINNSKYTWSGDTGNHTLRIEQDKIIKFKHYWVLFPVMILLSLVSGDGETDGKTPFYAVYEADIYMDKDIEISVNLYDVNRHMKKSKQGLCYKFDVEFSKETEVKAFKKDFTATPKEKKRWFLFHAILFSILFVFLICMFIFAGLNSIGIIGVILSGTLAFLSSIGWIFFIHRFYKQSNREYKSYFF